MKQKLGSEEEPGAHSKLIFAAVGVALVVVLSVYGIQNIRSQVSELQQQLDLKSDELELTSSQLTEERQALETKSGELELAQSELVAKDDELEQVYGELDASSLALADANAQLAETVRQLNDSTSELESAQSDLAQVRDELEAAQSELAEINDALIEAESELPRLSNELETSQSQLQTLQNDLAAQAVELEAASIVVEESHIEFSAFNWAYQIAACIVKETRNLADFWLGEDDRFSSVQSARYRNYQQYLTDDIRLSSPLREYCMRQGRDIDMLADRWWDRAFSRMARDTGLDVTELREVSKRYGGILVPHEAIMKYVDEILTDMETYVGDWSPAMTIPTIRSLWFGRV